MPSPGLLSSDWLSSLVSGSWLSSWCLTCSVFSVPITSLGENLALHLLLYNDARGLLSGIDASSFAIETLMVIIF